MEDFSEDLTDDEPWARFIEDEKYIKRAESPEDEDSVRAARFYPAPKDHKTSGFRVKGLEKSQVWVLGEKYFLKPYNETRLARGYSRKSLLGRADLTVAQIKVQGLSVEPDNIPPRHASITGWPRAKSKYKLIAMQLAAIATVRLVEDGQP